MAWTDGVKSVFPSFQRGSSINNLPATLRLLWHQSLCLLADTSSPLSAAGVDSLPDAPPRLCLCCRCLAGLPAAPAAVFPAVSSCPVAAAIGSSGLDGCAGGDSGIENLSRGLGVLRGYKLLLIDRISNLNWN